MSEYWTILILESPQFIPEANNQTKARNRLSEIAPRADEITIETHDKIIFYDCGSNFERMNCPICKSDISFEWWRDRMDEDYGDGFKFARYSTPCCEKSITLNDIIYDWPQGFARFALTALNASVGVLDSKSVEELSALAGTPLRVIYRHL